MSEKGYAGAVSVKRIGTDWYWAQLSSVARAGGRAGLQRGEDGMGRGLMLFSDERSMVCCFTMHLREASSPWGIVRLGTEFYYQRGRADVVAVLEDGTVIAFEAKLKRWKDALHQAYRNLCFADASFVVTPREIAPILARHQAQFVRFGVGLCTVSEDSIAIIHQPPVVQPLQPWLGQRAMEHVFAGDKR